jgi:hypothetical protein
MALSLGHIINLAISHCLETIVGKSTLPESQLFGETENSFKHLADQA